jgi:PrtD family type I secretion system ABC transporter
MMPKPEFMRLVQSALKACSSHIGFAVLFSALINILYLAPTLYMMQVYDRVVPSQGLLTLFWLSLVVLLALAVLYSLDLMRSRLMVRAALRFNEALAGQVVHRLNAEQSRTATKGAGTQALREFDTLRQTLAGQGGILALFDIPWTLIYLLAAFLIHPALAGLVVIGGALLISLSVINDRTARSAATTNHQAMTRAYGNLEALLSKSEVIRVMGMQKRLETRFISDRNRVIDATADQQIKAAKYAVMGKFIRTLLQSAALGLGGWLAVTGHITVGSIIAASVLLSRALQPLEQVASAWPALNQARAAIVTLNDLFGDNPDPDHQPLSLPVPSGRITMNSLFYRARSGGPMILKGLNVQLVPGEIVGLIGPSGAGKSTFAKIVVGALKPDAGDIRIDGATYRDWNTDALGVHFGYMPQTNMLLGGTIAQNISRFSNPAEADRAALDAQIVEAAKRAGVHEMILQFPDGYNTLLSSSGEGISVGQAQRISLARALFGDPKVLVLDEPNSALDTPGEMALIAAMTQAKARGTTVLIIAHRPSMLQNADRVIVLNGGTIERQGTRDEVMGPSKGLETKAVDLRRPAGLA